MTFEKYYKIMKEHGIGELFFTYKDKEYSISMEILDFKLNYEISGGDFFENFDSLDEMVSSEFLNEGFALKDIWDDVEIIEIDGVQESEYDVESCSYNYVKSLEDLGELQYDYNLGVKKSFFIQLKYVILGVLILPILSILLPLFNLTNWNFLFLSGGCGVFAIILAIIIMLGNRLSINYQITTKKIIVFKGTTCSTNYNNIKKIKLKKGIFNKKQGTIKLYLKKGFSLNYSLEKVPNPEQIYKLISDNIENDRRLRLQ